MKQYDLYKNEGKSKKGYPYFVDVQADLLRDLNSRVVIPISTAPNSHKYPKNLCPVVTIQNKDYALMTHLITSIDNSALSNKEGSLGLDRDDIVLALDFLFMGI